MQPALISPPIDTYQRHGFVFGGWVTLVQYSARISDFGAQTPAMLQNPQAHLYRRPEIDHCQVRSGYIVNIGESIPAFDAVTGLHPA